MKLLLVFAAFALMACAAHDVAKGYPLLGKVAR